MDARWMARSPYNEEAGKAGGRRCMGRLIMALPCSRILNHIKLDLCCSCHPCYFRSLFALAIRATSVPCLLFPSVLLLFLVCSCCRCSLVLIQGYVHGLSIFPGMYGQRVLFKRPASNLQARVNVFSALVGKRGCSARSVFISHMMDSWLKWYLQDRSNRASKHLDMENFMASAFIPWSKLES